MTDPRSQSMLQLTDVPNRPRALVMGIIGGAIGGAVAYWVDRQVIGAQLPNLEVPLAAPLDAPDPIEDRSPLPRQYRPGEDALRTEGRIAYTAIKGYAPQPAEANQLDRWTSIAWGMLWGAAYGGSRTTTRGRDIAGGFFFGMRLWVFDVTIRPLLGTQPGPSKFSLPQLGRMLLVKWVYSFTMTAITRKLYRILSPENEKR